MVKHSQTIRQQQPTSCLSVFDHFVGLALKGLKKEKYTLPKFTKYSSCGVSTDMQSAFSSIVDGTAFKPSNV